MEIVIAQVYDERWQALCEFHDFTDSLDRLGVQYQAKVMELVVKYNNKFVIFCCKEKFLTVSLGMRFVYVNLNCKLDDFIVRRKLASERLTVSNKVL